MSGPQQWRDRLVDALVAAGRICDVAVEAAFRAVPRELFLPGIPAAQAYHDEAVVTGWDSDGRPLSSSSQPSIMAAMLEQLAVQPGDRVLEVGAGTGYNAALLAHLAGAGGHVVCVDIDEQVARQARANLDRAGRSTVEVIHADGVAGWAAGAPYDRIILTAGARDLAPAWLAQLTRTGRLVLPLSLRGMQRSVAFVRDGEHLTSHSIVNCGFMPLRGALAGPDGSQPLGRPGTFVMHQGSQSINPGALQAALEQPGRLITLDIAVTDAQIMGELGLWIVLHEPNAALLTAVGSAADAGALPVSRRLTGMTIALAVLGDRSFAALVRSESAAAQDPTTIIQQFGPDAAEPAARLSAQLHAWNRHGPARTPDLTIRAYPKPTTRPTAPAAALIELPHTTLALDWPRGPDH